MDSAALRTHAVDVGQQLKAALFLPALEAVKVVVVLPNGFGHIKPGIFPELQLGGGVGGDAAAVAPRRSRSRPAPALKEPPARRRSRS